MIMSINTSPSIKKLLIVGGTGFIGKHVAKEAIDRGYQVTIISKNYCAAPDKLEGAEYILVDITNNQDLWFNLKDKHFQYVINLGGYVNHANYFEGGGEVLSDHLTGTMNLVSCVNKKNLQCFIQIGSSDEYGDTTAPQHEEQREMPISTYSFAKTAATHFLQMLFRTEKFPAAILRPFLVYGAGQECNRFIPQVIEGCIRNKKFPLSNGDQLRDFCYIEDIVEVIFLVLHRKDIHGEIINIASGIPISIREVVTLIKTLVGLGEPQFGKIPYRNSENMSLYADISKAQCILNWSPQISLINGLEKTIVEYAKD